MTEYDAHPPFQMPTDLNLKRKGHPAVPYGKPISDEVLTREQHEPLRDNTALHSTAQWISYLTFSEMIELCSKTIAMAKQGGQNQDEIKIEPYDLATGLSKWAIEALSKKEQP